MSPDSLGTLDRLAAFIHLSILADIGSLIGFVITVWVALQVRAIRRQYLFKARVPALLDKIDSSASNLSNLLNSYDKSSSEVEIEVRRIGALLESIRGKAQRNARASTRSAIDAVQEYRANRNKQNARDVYVAARTAVFELREYLNDRQLES